MMCANAKAILCAGLLLDCERREVDGELDLDDNDGAFHASAPCLDPSKRIEEDLLRTKHGHCCKNGQGLLQTAVPITANHAHM